MANLNGASIPFQKKFSIPIPRPSSPQRPTVSTSKILPLFCQKNASRNRPPSMINKSHNTLSQPQPSSRTPSPEIRTTNIHRFPAAGAAPYVPISQCRTPYHGIAPPVTIRTAVPVFSAPPPPAQVMQPRPVRVAPPISIRQAVPSFSAPSRPREDPPYVTTSSAPLKKLPAEAEEISIKSTYDVDHESTAVRCVEQLEI